MYTLEADALSDYLSLAHLFIFLIMSFDTQRSSFIGKVPFVNHSS
jgi:hypothetical protein